MSDETSSKNLKKHYQLFICLYHNVWVKSKLVKLHVGLFFWGNKVNCFCQNLVTFVEKKSHFSLILDNNSAYLSLLEFVWYLIAGFAQESAVGECREARVCKARKSIYFIEMLSWWILCARQAEQTRSAQTLLCS